MRFTQTASPVTGKILEILQDESERMAFVVVDIFQVSALRHEYFGMPSLSRRSGEITLLVIPAKVSPAFSKILFFILLVNHFSQLCSNTTSSMTVDKPSVLLLGNEQSCRSGVKATRVNLSL
jgi:hypothetical protein